MPVASGDEDHGVLYVDPLPGLQLDQGIAALHGLLARASLDHQHSAPRHHQLLAGPGDDGVAVTLVVHDRHRTTFDEQSAPVLEGQSLGEQRSSEHDPEGPGGGHEDVAPGPQVVDHVLLVHHQVRT